MLMIKPIVCDHCKTEVKELKYMLIWTKKSEWCKTCGQHKEEKETFEFCTVRCLRLHSVQLDNHKHKWDFGRFGASAQINGIKIEKVHVWCAICKEQRWMKPTKELIKEYHKLNPNTQTLINAVAKGKQNVKNKM